MKYAYKGIDHVQVASPPNQEDIARLFYTDILGFTEIKKPTSLAKRGGIWYQVGNHQLHIGNQTNFSAATKAHPAFEVINLELLKTKLKEAEIDIIEDYNIQSVNRFYISDPFGNRLEFLERN